MENNRTNRITECALCGEALNGDSCKRYYFQPAISKWLEEIIDEDESVALSRMIYNRSNAVFVHEACKERMAEQEVKVDDLHLPWFAKTQLKEIQAKIEPYAKQYRDLKMRMFDRQGHKCYKCGCEISEGSNVIRRIDPNGPRTEENGCLVCAACEKYEDFLDVVPGQAVAAAPEIREIPAAPVTVAPAPAPEVAAPTEHISGGQDLWSVICRQQKELLQNIKTYENEIRRELETVEQEISAVENDMVHSTLDVEAGYLVYQKLQKCVVRRCNIEKKLEKVESILSSPLNSFVEK